MQKTILLRENFISAKEADIWEDFEISSFYEIWLMCNTLNICGKNARKYFDLLNDCNASELKETDVINLSDEEKNEFKLFLTTLSATYTGYKQDIITLNLLM